MIALPPAVAVYCLGPLSQIPRGEGRMFQLPCGEPPGAPAAALVADSGLALVAGSTSAFAADSSVALLAVFHLRSGAVHATQAACPHRNGPLADGLIGGTTLICPLHGRKFDLSSGAALSGGCDLTTFPVRVTETGEIMVYVDPAVVGGGEDRAAPGQ